ncbi:unnamed protein product, partial [Mesorhabditis belari]|uniref:Uncharacterized protein n=1 Tax=Mesorhabditis belari TaxID=2138241 RepID=A0AAF3EN20_9BILA
MASQIDERDAAIEFDSAADCSIYSTITAVDLLELQDDPISTLSTAHDASVYSLLESVISVSMVNFAKDTVYQEDVDLSTAWECSDPSCYTPARNTCIVEFSDGFLVPEAVSLESVLSENVSFYEVMPSEIEVEPTFAYQTFGGVRAIDSLDEVSKRTTTKLIPVFPEYTQFAWNDVKTDVSERSMSPSEIEVEFEPWNEWCRGFVDGGKQQQ